MNKEYSINCKGQLISLQEPRLMGILNVTPDSFYDGGENNSIVSALKQTEKMLNEGADFIDIGAISTRPGSDLVTEQEELIRLSPIIKAILKEFPETLISIDTFRSQVAKEVIEMGACIINDISGGTYDKDMFKTISKLNCPYILMHLRGNFENMHTLTQYDNVTRDVIRELANKINDLRALNVIDVIIDPGFGFSKTVEQNYMLLNELDIVSKLIDLPILAGLSRKSMIWKTLESCPENALNGTTALNMIALQNGTKILRVHDVKEAKECITLYSSLNN